MGFDVAEGGSEDRLVQSYAALSAYARRPPRTLMHDTFYVEGGPAHAPNLLRTHQPVQVRYAVQHVKKHRALLDAGQAAAKSASSCPAAPTARSIAARHAFAAHVPPVRRAAGLAKIIGFKDLKGRVYRLFCRTFFESDDLVLRFRPSFFPFTEPSAEIDIQFQTGPLAGRQLEVAGSGGFTPTWCATWA